MYQQIRRLIKFTIALTAVLSGSVLAQSTERGEARERIDPYGWVYGAALNVNQQLYKGFEQRTMLFPLIGYRGKRFELYGPFMRYRLADAGNWQFSANVSPRFNGFEAEDSPTFEGMEKRKTSLDAGFGARYEWNDYRFSVNGMADVLNASSGTELSAGFSKVYNVGPIFIEPNISISSQDAELVDYYYGVRSDEVRDNRPQYSADSAVNITYGISVMTPIFFNGLARVMLQYTDFDTAITDSPLVEGNSGVSMMLMYSKML